MAKSKGHVLIVEDDPDLSDAFKIILTKEGYRVTNTYNGQEALEKLKLIEPDMILLDLLMPIMGGEEFLKRFKQAGHKLPVVVFTNLDAQHDIEEVQKLGASRYILKSWASPDELVKVVKETLSQNS